MARLLALLLLLAAQPAAARSWTEEKCELYGQAWTEMVRQRGTEGLSPGFLAAHDAFLASGCRDRGACPRSAADATASTLTLVSA